MVSAVHPDSQSPPDPPLTEQPGAHSEVLRQKNKGAGRIVTGLQRCPIMLFIVQTPCFLPHTQQNVFSGEKYGAVTLLTSYRRSDQRLRVEVLNAVNLLPMDYNGTNTPNHNNVDSSNKRILIWEWFAGFSDPFVQLCLEPQHIFPEVETRSTQIKPCDLNPLFDEAFELLVVLLSNFSFFSCFFSDESCNLHVFFHSLVSLDQCQTPGACLVVTVLDHDILRSDDFQGEAFLSLKAIPGVGGAKEDDGLTVTPDKPPAQIRLPLMHPKPNGEIHDFGVWYATASRTLLPSDLGLKLMVLVVILTNAYVFDRFQLIVNYSPIFSQWTFHVSFNSKLMLAVVDKLYQDLFLD